MTLSTEPRDGTVCAHRGCAAVIVPGQAKYIDGCGEVCDDCFGPTPDWFVEIEPPF
jgi:hypothetical protein